MLKVKQKGMKLIDFIEKFPNEEACKLFFKEEREKQGITCKKCPSKEHYWMKTKELYKCKKCNFMFSLKSGTVMENSKLPYRYWLIALHLVTSTKKTISALELQRQIGHKFYEPIWAMMHKIRLVLGKRDANYKLANNIEIDEGFISTGYSFEINDFTGEKEELKRGKGSQKKTKVLVMVSFKKVKKGLKSNYKNESIPQFIKMKTIDDLTTNTLCNEIKKSVESTSNAVTDEYKSYKRLPEIIHKHTAYDMSKFDADKVLPWVHKAITNSKNLLKSVHHCVWSDYLQNYLDEFCFKFNRRYFGEKVFDRAVIAAVSNVWY